jgi:hypothetical protein
MMDSKLIFWPAVVQMALTLYLYIRLKNVKAEAVKAGAVFENMA